MEQLIKVSTNSDGKQVVSARNLHEYLQAGSNVNTWFKNQAERAMLDEGIDFIQIYEESTGGRPSIDYAVSLAAAKEISMLNGGEKGKKARLYFIECEKQLSKITIPKTLSEALYLAAEQAKTIEEQTIQLKLQEPKVEFAEQILSATNSLDFGTSCKAMNLPFGRNRMFEICRELGFLMDNNQPYQSQINIGHFTLLETSFIHPKSGDRVLTTKTMITPKGQSYLIKNFKKNGYM